MKHALASLTIGACLLLPAGVVLGASPTTKQPGASAGVACLNGSATMTPGQAASAPGSVFNEPGTLTQAGGTAGQHYAGQPNTPSLAANSTAAVSQYDIACANVTAHQPP